MPIRSYSLAVVNDETPFHDASQALAGIVGFQVIGTFTGTIDFLAVAPGQADNQAVAIQAVNLGTGAQGTSATVAGIYRIDASGGLRVKAKLSALSAGGPITVQPFVALG